eukprot:UN08714
MHPYISIYQVIYFSFFIDIFSAPMIRQSQAFILLRNA